MAINELELDPCRHGEQNPTFCAICRDEVPQSREIVYFTSGGQHFHRNPKCTSLAEGQALVAERGGIPALLDTGYLETVRQTRKACKTCAKN